MVSCDSGHGVRNSIYLIHSKILLTKPHSGIAVLMLSYLLPIRWQGHAVVSDHTVYVTLLSATVSAIPEMPTELAEAVTSGDLPAVNALFKRRDGHGGNGDKKKKQQQCWYHVKFGDESRCCSGPPCPRYRADLPKGRTTESGNAKGSR